MVYSSCLAFPCLLRLEPPSTQSFFLCAFKVSLIIPSLNSVSYEPPYSHLWAYFLFYRIWAGYPEVCVLYCSHLGSPVGWGDCGYWQQLLCPAGSALWTPGIHYGKIYPVATYSEVCCEIATFPCDLGPCDSCA